MVAVATAVLREGGSFGSDGEVVLPRTTRVDGPVPKVVSHATAEDEAAWVADRIKMSRTPGRQWSSIAVLTRTNAQLAMVQAAWTKKSQLMAEQNVEAVVAALVKTIYAPAPRIEFVLRVIAVQIGVTLVAGIAGEKSMPAYSRVLLAFRFVASRARTSVRNSAF